MAPRPGMTVDHACADRHDAEPDPRHKSGPRFSRSARSVAGFVPDRVTTDGHLSYRARSAQRWGATSAMGRARQTSQLLAADPPQSTRSRFLRHAGIAIRIMHIFTCPLRCKTAEYDRTRRSVMNRSSDDAVDSRRERRPLLCVGRRPPQGRHRADDSFSNSTARKNTTAPPISHGQTQSGSDSLPNTQWNGGA